MKKRVYFYILVISSVFIFQNVAYSNCISGDCVNGEGVFIDKDKYQYIGTFKNSKFEGKGILKADNGNKYEGYFKDGELVPKL